LGWGKQTSKVVDSSTLPATCYQSYQTTELLHNINLLAKHINLLIFAPTLMARVVPRTLIITQLSSRNYEGYASSYNYEER